MGKKLVLWSLELQTNAVPESFSNGFCTIVYKINIALSGLLVCRFIKSLTEVLSSKLSHSPSKLLFSVEFSFFEHSFSQGHYQSTYQRPDGVYLLNL